MNFGTGGSVERVVVLSLDPASRLPEREDGAGDLSARPPPPRALGDRLWLGALYVDGECSRERDTRELRLLERVAARRGALRSLLRVSHRWSS